MSIGARLCLRGVSDFNHDGENDFFLVGSGGSTSWGGGRGTADVVNTSTSTSNAFTAYTFANTYWGNRCDAVDLNGDGFQDVAIENVWFSDPAVVYLNSAQGPDASAVFEQPDLIDGSPLATYRTAISTTMETWTWSS